jgi:Tfp pilus assembly protein PilV
VTVRDERGTTFVEILVAMVIMATVVIAIIAGIGATTASSGTHRRQAEAQTILKAAVERLRSNDEVAYRNCALETEATYLAAARVVSLPSTAFATSGITIDDVQYWNGGSSSPEFDTAVASCQDTVADANGNFIYRLQLIKLKVQSTNGQVSETLSFIKAGA